MNGPSDITGLMADIDRFSMRHLGKHLRDLDPAERDQLKSVFRRLQAQAN